VKDCGLLQMVSSGKSYTSATNSMRSCFSAKPSCLSTDGSFLDLLWLFNCDCSTVIVHCFGHCIIGKCAPPPWAPYTNKKFTFNNLSITSMQFQQMYKNNFKGSIFTLHPNVEVAPFSSQHATLKLPHPCSSSTWSIHY
jgi:hypothetical protein